MINETMYQLGSKQSCIRELFMFGLERAKTVGKENVYDFSIGNPSVPAPQRVVEAFKELKSKGIYPEEFEDCKQLIDNCSNLKLEGIDDVELFKEENIEIKGFPTNFFIFRGSGEA